MAFVLTTSSRIVCGSQGAVSTSGQAKLTVGGVPVLVKAGVAGKSLSGCTVVTNASSGTKQCSTVASVSAGEATKLTVGGAAVMLDTLAGTADGLPTPGAMLTATANQSKLKAV